jgi:hypothetical protein
VGTTGVSELMLTSVEADARRTAREIADPHHPRVSRTRLAGGLMLATAFSAVAFTVRRGNPMPRFPMRSLLAVCLVLLFAVASGGATAAGEQAAALVVEPDAVAAAKRAGDYLREQDRFSFTAVTAYEVVQEDGSRLEFGGTRHYLVRRPDRVRVETQARSGERRLLVLDGDQLTYAELDANVYAKLEFGKHREIDAVIDLLRGGLGIPLPLAELLRSDPREELTGDLIDAFLVGSETLEETPCDHLALRTDDTELQLWIAQGEKPLLQRIVITYRDEPGEPSFMADFRDWKLGKRSSDRDFRWDPPKDAQRIPFAVRAVRPASAPAVQEDSR